MAKPNGHDSNDPKIAYFPTPQEREALKKAKDAPRKPVPPGEPILNLPPVVKMLCLINIAVFLFNYFLNEAVTPEFFYNLSFVPARYSGIIPFDIFALSSPITHMFTHVGWMHLGLNVAMLMAFGTGIEKALGAKKMLLFYFATGLCGAFTHAIIYSDALVPMIGASGAISGLFGGILILMKENNMMGNTKSIMPFVILWIAISVIFGFFGTPGSDNPIAWTTHIGGFIAGVALYKPIRNLKI